jgi:hypothetical protein
MLKVTNIINEMIEQENISEKLNMSVNDYTTRKNENKKKKDNDDSDSDSDCDGVDSGNEVKNKKIEVNNFFTPQNKKINDILGVLQTYKLKKNISEEEMSLKKYLHKESTSFPNKLTNIKDTFIKDLDSSLTKRKLNFKMSSL